ncbi:PEP-CTERM sorting domain-containing protein [Kiritimatiellota bacterium B12222]|nr:PEP-CTERM sorting domain-containing protein [Kiritimatiellota bacterium B12222]
MNFPFPLIKVSTFLLLLLSSISFGDMVLISDAFGGLSSETLNGTDAGVFSSEITAAGGSATWVASDDFRADGSMVGTESDSALLYLGSYINDRKGTAVGKFSLTATLDPLTGAGVAGGDFLSLGFFVGAIATDDDFASDGTQARATAITRVSSDSGDYFNGPGASGGANAINGVGLRTYTIVLDFTLESGYNGVTHNGTVTYHSDNDGGIPHSYTFSGVQNLEYIGITRDDGVLGGFSGFELRQIPEPSSLLLIFATGMGLVVLRRRLLSLR